MKIWKQADFNEMGWHDCVIWAMRFDDNLYFDLDYILNAINTNNASKLEIVPVTLVFYDVENFSISLKGEWINGLEINKIERKDIGNKKYHWTIELQEGLIIFDSPIFKQFAKKESVIVESGCLNEEDRGGYNFEIGR